MYIICIVGGESKGALRELSGLHIRSHIPYTITRSCNERPVATDKGSRSNEALRNIVRTTDKRRHPPTSGVTLLHRCTSVYEVESELLTVKAIVFLGTGGGTKVNPML